MTQTATAGVSHRSTAPPGRNHELGGGFVAVLAFAGIAVSVMQTLVVPLLTELPQLLNTSTSNASWVVTSTLLAGAVATPVMGRLGDMFGKRRLMLVALGLLVLGSLICAVTSDLIPMVTGRAVQGGAMGAIPLGISIMRDELPPQKLGSAMALMSSSLGVGAALGLPAAAFVAQHTDWHALFFGSAGIGALAMLLIVLVVPESAVRAPGRFDFVGAIGLSVGLVCLLLPITKGGDWGWGSGNTLALFGAAVVILVAWGLKELRTAEPLVDLRTTARRQVLLTNLASILVGFSFYGMNLVLPQLLQLPSATGYGLGQSMVVAGLCVAPMGVAMMLVSPLSARINASRGPKISLMLGIVVVGISYAAGMVMLDAVWQVVIVASILGVGIGIAYSAMPSLIISAVPPGETGAANGLNTLMRSIGTSTSSAVVGVILAHSTTDFHGAPLPNLDGFKSAFAVAVVACVVGVLIAAFLPGRRPAPAALTPAASSQPAATSAVAEDLDLAAVPDPFAEAPWPVPAEDDLFASDDVFAPAGGPGGRVVHGRVLGPDGAPLANAAVTLIDSSGRQLGRALSLADGRYAVRAPGAGSVVVIGSASGHRPRAVTLRVLDGPLAHDVRLGTGEALLGTARTADDQVPAAAVATVTTPDGAVAGSATADERGDFALGDLAPGAYTLTVGAPGFRPYVTRVDLGRGRPARIEALLRPAARVRGTVRNRDGRPLEDARVSLLDAAGDVVGVSLTDGSGAFGFEGLDGERYTVVAGGYAPVSAPVTVGGTGTVPPRDVDFVLRHG